MVDLERLRQLAHLPLSHVLHLLVRGKPDARHLRNVGMSSLLQGSEALAFDGSLDHVPPGLSIETGCHFLTHETGASSFNDADRAGSGGVNVLSHFDMDMVLSRLCLVPDLSFGGLVSLEP